MDILANISKDDIQGFITSGFKHTYHSAYLFLQIIDKAKAQAWLSKIEINITSARSWRPTAEPLIGPGASSEPPKEKPREIINIAFSFEGLRELGLTQEVLSTFPIQFQQGMAEPMRSLFLGDTNESSSDNWEIGNPNKPKFHILLILNAGDNPDDTSEIEAFATKQKESLITSGLQILHDERGYRRLDDKELFGFRDGIGQPKIEGINIYEKGKEITNAVKTGEFILGYPNAYNLLPPTPVLPKELDVNNLLPTFQNPYNVDDTRPSSDLKDLGLHGSYLVYRKLKQDVVGFWKYIIAEVRRQDGEATPERVIWLASKFVGRLPTGDPLAPLLKDSTSQDGFLYAAEDKEGLHCPIGSHIRRTNPRDVLQPENSDESRKITAKHRIMRRGRVFGDSLFDLTTLDNFHDDSQLEKLMSLEDKPDSARGLHFICVNADIQRQFEFIQDSWSNNPNFNELHENKDPILGDNSNPHQPHSYMTIPALPVRIRTTSLPRFVTVLGGAYLFMPSLTALRFLAQL